MRPPTPKRTPMGIMPHEGAAEGTECVARSRVAGLYEGVLLGKAGLPGVIAVYGRSRSRWFDVHRRGLR